MLLGLGSSLVSTGCGGDDGASPEPGEDKDASTPAGKPDAKTGKADTGTPKPVDDAGSVPSGDPKLDAIAGRYLMRFDTFGTGTTIGVSIRSRVSLLFVTELVVEGDHLKATERMCNQVAKQTCLTGCEEATTIVDPRVITNFFQKTKFEREYTLGADGRTIRGGYSATELGYSGDVPLPTSSNDKAVWDVISDQAPREGILTSLQVTKLAPFGTTLTCDVYGTEKLVASFSGTLGGTDTAPEFPTMTIDFKTPDTDAARLGSTSAACDAAGNSPNDKAVARLVRYDDGAGLDCPDDAVFDDKLAPDPVVDP